MANKTRIFNGLLFEADHLDLIHLAVDIAVEEDMTVATIAEHLKKWVVAIPDPSNIDSLDEEGGE